ncbi:hypothetical protein TRV_01188 [Trichophyton verrucosum HKI 0517]|uniref:Uncharacterized protein n=1 Tax=Trichophyton verrucosum (strain HKI 0517) TaxID=663202 RepID=D4D286_TRIVH|nr:uncharacterized protein TRV_01188 [Trichophyton verrucosum HKI 0517]EFE44009.1 hypothetical protein TRV_01188 [Trichophyton verrucosum HKI 0517]
MSTETLYARSWGEARIKSQSLNIYTHDIRAASDIALSETKPTTLNSKQRMGFWSKFKRSKSQNINNYHTKPDALPQRAKSDANLVWCPEQKIWLFARQSANNSSLSPQTQRHNSQQKPTATTRLPPPAEYGEEELLFAQLPGHYCLGIYTETNNEPVSPCEPDYFDFSGQKALQTSRWMSVAQRVGPGNAMS